MQFSPVVPHEKVLNGLACAFVFCGTSMSECQLIGVVVIARIETRGMLKVEECFPRSAVIKENLPQLMICVKIPGLVFSLRA